MSRESVFDNMGTGFSSVDILQEPEVREDQLNGEILNTLKLFDGYHFSAFWRLTVKIAFSMVKG